MNKVSVLRKEYQDLPEKSTLQLNPNTTFIKGMYIINQYIME